MIEIQVFNSLDTIEPLQWNACFAHELEDHAYLHATEKAAMQGFTWRYLTAWKNGILVAAIPAFFTNYSLDTTLEGTAKKITKTFRSFFPNLFTLKLACLGSPNTEYGRIGFHPAISAEQKQIILREMLNGFESYAFAQGYSFIGIKDIPSFHSTLWQKPLHSHGYNDIAGLPVAWMDIDFTSMEGYFKKLSYGTRKNMRRKLRTLDTIRIEYRDNIDDVLNKVMALYRDTRGRAEMQFEELTPQFFQNILKNSQGRAFCTLYFLEQELLAVNLMLNNESLLLDKFFAMNGTKGRDYNLYFLSWFINIRYCLDHGLKRYQLSQAAYENKLRLGCQLTETTMYFKHKNGIVQAILRLLSPLLAADVTKDTKTI